MISYDRDPQQTIPESSVKIIGLGGAGANMLDRAALDGMTGAEMLCINTDMRTLSSSVAGEKIQIGKNLNYLLIESIIISMLPFLTIRKMRPFLL